MLDYGWSYGQIHAINADSLHLLGFDGTGIRIAVLDNGFDNMIHPAFSHLKIAKRRDFVGGEGDTIVTGGTHGQQVLSTTAAYMQGQLIGSAWNATYLLARTEANAYEGRSEEDNWLAAAEWAWENGAHVITSSVGYDWFDDGSIDHTHEEMDGKTTVITKAAQAAAARGIVVVECAGNERNDPLWANPDGSMSLLFPADGDSVIAVGNMNIAGVVASTSSMGPTADGRIKPDICAVGTTVRVVLGTTSYQNVSGTSFAAPTTAGVVALLLQAHPTWDPIAVRTALRISGDHWDRPNNQAGWGMIDAMKALRADSAVFGRLLGLNGEPIADEFVRLWDPVALIPVETKTSPDGWFRFEHVPPGPYHLYCGYGSDFANPNNVGVDTALSLPMLPREIHLQLKEQVSVTAQKPSAFVVSEAYPNPANPGTAFHYTLPTEHARTITLRVYSVTGQVVWQQAFPANPSGMLTWNGRTWSGREAASGVYLARIECGTESTVKRVVLVR
jgi:subtilase family protein